MYKVFIDNVPKSFEVGNEIELQKAFPDHEYIEAAGGIVRKKDHFLFIKRHGLWDIPKGKLEKGESPEEGAVREIEEECDIQGLQLRDHLMDTFHTYEQKGKLYLKKTFWYIVDVSEDEQDLNPQTEEGITEVRFFKWNELGQVKSNTYQSIVEVIATLEGYLNS